VRPNSENYDAEFPEGHVRRKKGNTLLDLEEKAARRIPEKGNVIGGGGTANLLRDQEAPPLLKKVRIKTFWGENWIKKLKKGRRVCSGSGGHERIGERPHDSKGVIQVSLKKQRKVEEGKEGDI